MIKAYSIGFLGAAVAVLVTAGIWLALQPRQEEGLRWGGTVYTSKQEFNVYLRSKGLSYRTWLARNPGAAPWEPSAGGAATVPGAETSRPTTGTSKLRAVEDWLARLPLSTIALLGLQLAMGFALLLGLWRLRLLVARAPAREVDVTRPRAGPDPESSGGTPRTRVATPRPGIIARAAARKRGAPLPGYTERFLAGVRADARWLRVRMQERNISAGDVAFGVLAVLTAGVFGMFVVFLLSA